MQHILNLCPAFFPAPVLLQAAALCHFFQKRGIILDLFQTETDIGTVNMDVLLLGQTGIFFDEIALAVFQDIFRQALHGLFLDHPLDDLFDKRSQAFQGLGKKLGIAVNRPETVDVGIVLPLVRILQNVVDIENIAGEFLPLRFHQLLEKLGEKNALLRHDDVFFIRGIVNIFFQPAHFPRAEAADHTVGKLIIVCIFLRFFFQMLNLVLHQIDGQSIPDLTSRDPVSDLPVIFVIDEKQAVGIDPVAAPAGQTVEKAAGERVE